MSFIIQNGEQRFGVWRTTIGALLAMHWIQRENIFLLEFHFKCWVFTLSGLTPAELHKAVIFVAAISHRTTIQLSVFGLCLI